MTKKRQIIAVALCLCAASASAQVPQLISYQGRVVVGATNFEGTGQFQFALVNSNGTVTFWSNDGSSSGGSQPGTAVPLPVTRGLYSVLLGDTTLPGMPSALPVTVFTNSDVRLRVWFNDGVTGFQQLSPDQRVSAVGYALMSANVPDGVITSNKLATGAVTSSKLADGAVTATKIASGAIASNLPPTLSLGASNANGAFHVYATPLGTPAISLLGSANQIITYGDDGLEQARLSGALWGELTLYNSLSNNSAAVTLSANAASGGILSLRNTNGSSRATLNGANSGGSLTLNQADGGIGVFIDGENAGAGLLDVRNTNSITLLRLAGDEGGRIESAGTIRVVNSISSGDRYAELGKNGSGGGAVRTFDELGNNTTFMGSSGSGGGGLLNIHMNETFWPGVTLDGDDGNSGVILLKAANDSTRMVLDAYNGDGAELSMRHTNGLETVELIASEGGTEGGQLVLRSKTGVTTVQLDGDASGNGSGYLRLYNGSGAAAVTIEGDNAGEGRITTQVLQITGGSDLSESFNIQSHQSLRPGMLVAIDPQNPGELLVSSKAYDRAVAGVVSGAGGVKPGMLMGQAGTLADGKHPVALTGRVYCYVDADAGGPVQPGDLITTSATPGHGMKASDHARAAGAIVGKAMTKLESGKGLVLVLVSLQ
jgi:hypothetical protein